MLPVQIVVLFLWFWKQIRYGEVVLSGIVALPWCRYVEKVPLAAKVLDVRESQKLRIIDRLKLERQRVRFEAEIGKAPPLSDDELAEHIREEAYVTTSFMVASVNS